MGRDWEIVWLWISTSKVEVRMGRVKMIVTCAICGYKANVNPRVTSLTGLRPTRATRCPPAVWVCDVHFNQDKESS